MRFIVPAWQTQRMSGESREKIYKIMLPGQNDDGEGVEESEELRLLTVCLCPSYQGVKTIYENYYHVRNFKP